MNSPDTSGHDDQPSEADAQLMAELGTMLRRADPVPEALSDQAKQLLAWRDIDAQLELIADSSQALEGVRSTTVETGSRTLDMQGPDGLAVMVEIVPTGTDRFRVLGQVAGADTSVVVAIRVGDRISHTGLDEFGTFEFQDLAPGSMRLLLQVGDEPMLTPWFTL